jgi:magnesium chelatase family protein
MDRFDIHLDVPAVKYRELSAEYSGEPSSMIRKRVGRARNRQLERFSGKNIYSNSMMSTRDIKQFCTLGNDAQNLLDIAMNKLSLSARAYMRIIMLSRTIADLDGAANIETHHISEAIQYRTLDRGV